MLATELLAPELLAAELLAEVVLVAGVLIVEVAAVGVLTTGDETIVDVESTTDVEMGTELSTAEAEDVSEGDTGRVVFVALVGTTMDSVVLVLSVLGVVEGLCCCSTVGLVVLLVCRVVWTGVEVGSVSVVDVVGIGMGRGEVEGVVELDGVVDTSIMVVGVVSIGVDDSELLRRVSLNGNGDGGVWNGVLVADCVPFVTIMRLTCFRRYLGLSAPPCPAGAAAAAGLRVARTARDAAKTIDDLRTIVMTGYINIIRSIMFLIDVASLRGNRFLA